MSDEWQTDKAWADELLPDVTPILAAAAWKLVRVDVASEQMDRRQAVDLVITTDAGQIAWRARRPGCRYRDLTLRYRRRPNARAEWNRGYEVDKIISGFGDHYLYTWVV